jgi:hypothetical protein
MKIVEIDLDVYEKLKDLANPFEETTPNEVLRRVLGLTKQKTSSNGEGINDNVFQRKALHSPTISSINNLAEKTRFVHSALLTFLLDKHKNSKGNFSTSDIVPFMEKFHLVTPSRTYRNPWMTRDYKDRASCIRTIEHFRQCRKFGCWGGKNSKQDCNSISCDYHPGNTARVIKNSCDLRKPVIWKRQNPQSIYTYGDSYIKSIKDNHLQGQTLPLKELLSVFYPDTVFNKTLIDRFVHDFNLSDKEMTLFRMA